MSRPTKYNDTVAECILTGLMEGKSLTAVCKPDDMPTYQSVYNWFIKYPAFFEKYVQARKVQADVIADVTMDRGQFLWEKGIKGEADNSITNAYKAWLDTVKWSTAHLHPKKFKYHDDDDAKPRDNKYTIEIVNSSEKAIVHVPETSKK